MKGLYSIKSGAYKTSKDYTHLKELLDAGHYIVCFIHFDTKIKVAIKEHYSNVIASLAKVAREINANARKAA